jgi:excisionase family DNA binding protein
VNTPDNVIAFPDRDGTDGVDQPTPATVSRAVYTVKETAAILALSVNTTYQLIRDGEIPAIKLRGKWAVPKRRLHAWLDQLPTASVDDIEKELAALEKAAQRRNRTGA